MLEITDEQVKHMRDRFLNWTLPENLNPDGGISYKRSESAIKYNHPGPVGTNFLDAEQAEAMVRHMIEGLPEVVIPQGDELDEICISCEEDPDPNDPIDYDNYKCPKSKRPCGHHCNHSWSHEECCWCASTFAPIEESLEIELERKVSC